MWNKKPIKLILLLTLALMLTSCFNNPINYITNEGKFTKEKIDSIIVSNIAPSNKGFYASLDFELTDGEVDWEIINPKNETVFKGYVVHENGKLYRQLTYSSNLYNSLTEKEEVKSETDTNGNIINIPDFNYLQFETGSPSGEYQLYLKPINAEGSFKVQWSDKLPRK